MSRDMAAPSQPPAPVETQPELGFVIGADVQAESFVDKLKHAARVAAFPFTFTVEGLTRVEDTFQTGVLTALGRVPTDQFKQWTKEIWTGKRKVSGREFLELAFSREFRDSLDKIPVIPGWVKTVTTPEAELYGETIPKFSVGHVADFLTEAVVSPFSMVAMAPRSLVAATKLDKVTEVVTWPLAMPIRVMAKSIFSPETPWGFMIMRLRDPDAVLPPQVASALKLNSKALEEIAGAVREVELEIQKKHGMYPGLWARLAGKRNPDINEARVYKHMWFRDHSLNPKEAAWLDDLGTLLEKVQNDILARNPNVPGMDVIRNWVPKKDWLRPFIPVPKNKLLKAAEIGPSKTFRQRTTAGFPLRQGSLPFNPNELHPGNMDVMHSLDFFIGQVEKTAVLHDRDVGKGVLSYFGAKMEKQSHRLNPTWIKDATPQQFAYWLEKTHQLTGHSQTKPHILMNQLADRMWDNVKTKIESVAQQHRITKWFVDRYGLGPFGDPRIGRTTSITSAIVGRQMVAMLGGQLSSPIKNVSQLLNEGAISGVPAVWKGLYATVGHSKKDFKMWKGMTDAEKKLVPISDVISATRRRVNYSAQFNKLAHDNIWSATGSTFDNLLMGPFNFSESFVRGVSHNVYVAERLEKLGIKNLFDWEQLGGRQRQRIMQEGFLHSTVANFSFGVAGRSALMMHPALRIPMALQSYSWKQAEFAAKLFQTDGLAFTKLLALHGWMIESMYHAAGINAESWLGWGFAPPQGTLGQGPGIEVMKDLTSYVLAVAEDDPGKADQYIDRLRGGMREFMRAFGDPDTARGLQAGLAAAATFGALPIPIVAVGKTSKAYNEFMTGQAESEAGRVWRPISREDALKSYFLQTHENVESQRLRVAERRVRAKMDGVMRHRVNKFIKALQGQDGDEVRNTGLELYDAIEFRIPLTPNKIHGMFSHDVNKFRPTLRMVEDRVKNEIQRKQVGSGVREMLDSGWTFQVLSAMYVDNMMRDIEAGSTRRLQQ